MRRSLLLCIAVAAAVTGLAAPAARAADLPSPVPLARGWEFAPSATGPWKRVTVPHVFDGRPAAELFQGTTGVYRLRFRGPATSDGGAWALHFEGVRRKARVLLNGREVGVNDDPYTPFTLPAWGLRAGAMNELRVEVDNRRKPGWREGWWNWGGITRAVSLIPRGKVSMRGVAVMGQVDCSVTPCRATALVDGWMTSRAAGPVRPSVTVRLRPPGGRGPETKLTVRLRTVTPGETARVRLEIPVAGDPQLWAPEKPQLYGATVEASLGGRVVERVQERLGLRSVAVRGGRLELNGRRLALRGASIQEDVPGRGPALTDADIEGIVRDLEALGANVTRAHYLLDERLLDRFDEEGILVWNQAPVYHRDVQLRTAEGRAYELGTLRRTVIEARRHPSVITHSVANELSPQPDVNPTTAQWLESARTMAADLDPTVPISVDLMAWPGFPRQSAYARFRLLGVNAYFGWYTGAASRSTANLADLEPFLRSLHDAYPGAGLVMTEFGAESTMGGPANVKETFAYQAAFVRAYLDVVARNPFMSGALYWTLREFAVKPDWDGGAQREGVTRDGIHDKGLMEYVSGARKPAWAVAERAFAATPLYRSPMPRATAPSLATPPAVRDPSTGTLVLASIALTLLLALAAWLVWLAHGSWRAGAGGGPPSGPGRPDPLDELEARRRRVRATV
ncbi:MAG TPA: glycoside hydrolase family 2 TIM barrel-domain containing protein [Solirubrobacteraceae bacterium]|nr:glycoside hydrolase family 2 TIM barrel-domain containing protein [Solirubrobacteraceae bacterium]